MAVEEAWRVEAGSRRASLGSEPGKQFERNKKMVKLREAEAKHTRDCWSSASTVLQGPPAPFSWCKERRRQMLRIIQGWELARDEHGQDKEEGSEKRGSVGRK